MVMTSGKAYGPDHRKSLKPQTGQETRFSRGAWVLALNSAVVTSKYHNFKEGLIGIRRDKGKVCILGRSRYALRLPNNYCVLLLDNWPLSKLRILSAVEDN